MENLILNFDSHACLIYREDKDYNNRICPNLYIQAFSAYRYQLELSITRKRKAGSNNYYWESHAYCHPDFRNITEISEKVAKALIARIIELAQKYPTLLFNSAEYGANKLPQNEGFVHFHNQLLAGITPSVKLLN